MEPKFQAGMKFTDKYNRKFYIAEVLTRKPTRGEKYFLYNLYPQGTEPKAVWDDITKSRGFTFEPYLDILEETLEKILKTAEG